MSRLDPLPQHVLPTECNTPQYPPLQPKFKVQLEQEQGEKRKMNKRVFSFSKKPQKNNKLLNNTSKSQINNLTTTGRYSHINTTTNYPQSTTNTQHNNYTDQSDIQQSLLLESNKKKLKEKYQSVTSLSNQGVNILRELPSKQQLKYQKREEERIEQELKETNYRQWQQQYGKNRPKTAAPQGHGLKTGIQFAEYEFSDDYQDKDIIPLDPHNEFYDTYEEQLKKFNQMVFDKQGNFKYNKTNKLTKEEQEKLGEIQQAKKTNTKQTKQSEQKQIQQRFQPGATIQKIVKNAQEKATMHERKQAILQIKEKSLKALNQMMHITVREKLIEAAKQEVIRSSQEMNNEVDKLQREIDVLNRKYEKKQDNILDMENEAERQNEKNHMLQQNMDIMKEKFDQLKKNVENIERFIPEYTLLNERFELFSAKKIIQQYDKMEDHITELTMIGNKLEEDLQNKEKIQQEMKYKFEQTNAEMMQKELKRQKQNDMEMQSYKEKNLELENALQYKQKYIELTKNITFIYNKWSNNISVFPIGQTKDDGPRANVDNPKNMLNIMDKQISISTNELLQAYLRKIIVSANQLQRQYIPENVNNSFDPDIIYLKIQKLLQKFENKNRKLEQENQKLRKQAGIVDTQEDEQDLNDSEFIKDLSFCQQIAKQSNQQSNSNKSIHKNKEN